MAARALPPVKPMYYAGSNTTFELYAILKYDPTRIGPRNRRTQQSQRRVGTVHFW